MADPGNPNVVFVDQYANGYDQPPTAVNVPTFPIDPTNVPQVGDHVTSVVVNQQPYSINTAGGNTVSPAKISNIAGAPTAYQVNIYANGYLVAPTKTAVNAQIIDLDASAFNIGDQVAIFEAGGFTWIITSHPFATLPTRFPARLTSNFGGEAGQYLFSETVAPQGLLKPGGISGACKELGIDSQFAWSGLDVWMETDTVGNYWFFFPLGA